MLLLRFALPKSLVPMESGSTLWVLSDDHLNLS